MGTADFKIVFACFVHNMHHMIMKWTLGDAFTCYLRLTMQDPRGVKFRIKRLRRKKKMTKMNKTRI